MQIFTSLLSLIGNVCTVGTRRNFNLTFYTSACYLPYLAYLFTFLLLFLLLFVSCSTHHDNIYEFILI